MLMFVRQPLALAFIVALGQGFASPAAAAQTEPTAARGNPQTRAPAPDSIRPASTPTASGQREKTASQRDAADNWPTDDFGRPLRSCDVPWDFVPSK